MPEENADEALRQAFLSIDPFRELYDNLPPSQFGPQLIETLGTRYLRLTGDALNQCTSVFLKSAVHYGALTSVSADQYAKSEHGREVQDPKTMDKQLTPEASPAPVGQVVLGPAPEFSPVVHINMEIHISSDATAEQVDQIFASMRKHLFGSVNQ